MASTARRQRRELLAAMQAAEIEHLVTRLAFPRYPQAGGGDADLLAALMGGSFAREVAKLLLRTNREVVDGLLTAVEKREAPHDP